MRAAAERAIVIFRRGVGMDADLAAVAQRHVISHLAGEARVLEGRIQRKLAGGRGETGVAGRAGERLRLRRRRRAVGRRAGEDVDGEAGADLTVIEQVQRRVELGLKGEYPVATQTAQHRQNSPIAVNLTCPRPRWRAGRAQPR